MSNRSNMSLLIPAAALACALLGTTSCLRELFSFRSGSEIRFVAGTSGTNLSSKAAYSGSVSSGYERIDWEDGDLIRIYCAQASEPDTKWADYVILDGTVESDGSVSSATIMPFGEASLCWGEESAEHRFYAMYPSPEATNEGSISGSTVTGSIPGSQKILGLNATPAGSEPNFTATPDLSSEYMVSKRSIVNDSEADGKVNYGAVFLKFKPITTAIEFTITNNYSSEGDLLIKNVQLISAGHNIAGAFTADLSTTAFGEDGSGYPVCGSTEDGNTVKIDFTDIPGYDYSANTAVSGIKNYVKVAYGQTLRFTFFLKPDYDNEGKAIDVNDLTFKIVKADNTWVSTKLAYNDALKTGVSFPCHKKSFVKGILVPEGAQWLVKYDPSVAPWSADERSTEEARPEISMLPFVTSWENGYTDDEPMIKYNYSLDVSGQLEFGHEGTSNTSDFPDGKSTISITSEREYNHSLTRSVVWHLEYLDEESGDWKMAKANTKIGGLVTVSPVVSSLEDIETMEGEITISVDAAPADPNRSHQGQLRGATPLGDASHPYDLSMHDIQGKEYADGKAQTANCYVISAPGVYAFPLVYGNAIDYSVALAGGVNTPAFNPGGENPTTATYLSKFINSKGNPITEPHIELDLASDDISGWSAFPLWQDVASSAAIIADGGCTVLTSAQASAKGLTACGCGYVMFEISADSITQGNAIVAVSDGSGIVWSWHIWVTDRDLEAVSLPGSSLKMLPCNLGWVDNDMTSNFTFYNGASVRLRAVQNGSGSIKEFTVLRRAESTASSSDGTSPYWQWGRKDPFIRQCAASTAHSGYTAFTCSSSGSTLQYAMTRPDVFVINGGVTWYAGGTYRNLWSALDDADGISASGYASKPYKTIYDPCPPGFQMPQGNAFTGLDRTAANGALTKSGLRFASSSGAVAQVGTHGYYWTAVSNSASNCEAVSFGFNEIDWCQTLPGKITQGFSIRPVSR